MSLKHILAVAALMALGACSGSNAGGIFGGNPGLAVCNPGTAVQLARPAQGQTGVGAITSIEIVANGNTNLLGQTYQSWQLQIQSGVGGIITGGALNLASDPGGPHPYASDYFYTSAFQALQVGQTYSVSLTQNGVCQPLAIGSFST